MRKRDELTAGCMAKAGADEMCFVLLSRDAAAPATIRFWAHKRVQLGKNAPGDPQVVEALDCARIMEAEGGLHKPTSAPAVGDPIDYDAGKLMGTLAAEVVGVQPGNVHVEPLYQIRLAGTGETIWARPNLCRLRAQPRPPGSVLAALRLLDALAGRLHGRSADLPPDLADLGADVAEVARELEATLPPGPGPEPAG